MRLVHGKTESGGIGLSAAVIFASFFILLLLLWFTRKSMFPAPISQERRLERLQTLREVQSAENERIAGYGWRDKEKGYVRLPVERAMELVLREWREPAAAHGELVRRVEAVTAPPPAAPEQPSEFE